ncbi:MAG: hypothetical protein CMF69_05910 [Magnetovibrio sp.]|nr:hypothetical protein [Magnetovibrio sp.]|tara:strand:+ start:414 stop:668 length:255 start_codon:yes stop_codon:yes gene_type:complete
MRFRIDYNPKNENWEVKDSLCSDQVVGSHINAFSAQTHRKYEEALWEKFDTETQEVHVEHWCLFYSLDKNTALSSNSISTIATQ